VPESIIKRDTKGIFHEKKLRKSFTSIECSENKAEFLCIVDYFESHALESLFKNLFKKVIPYLQNSCAAWSMALINIFSGNSFICRKPQNFFV
jgi:hypothetical protein